jgi:hypothetical protein
MTKTGHLVLRAHVSVLHFPIVGTRPHVCTIGTKLMFAGLVCNTNFTVFSHAFGWSLLVTCDQQVCHLNLVFKKCSNKMALLYSILFPANSPTCFR